VSELGANTPALALAKAVDQVDRLVAVGIAATTTGQDAAVAQSVEAVRATASNAAIVLGGNAIRDAAHAQALGADVWTGREGTNVVECVETLLKTRRIGASPDG
jgi:methylmalonyl-CoA mutase cobalamin-binding subunit